MKIRGDVIDPEALARGIFDESWYPSEPGALGDEFAGFLALGARAVDDPHPLFSLAYYLAQAPELAESDTSPLLHFVSVGWKRGLSPHPLFDVRYYVRRYGADMVPGEDPLTHFLREGASLELQPSAWFDTEFYRTTYPDVVDSEINPLVHYSVFGASEGRWPHKEFDGLFHRRRRGLSKNANPLIDFLRRLDAARAEAVLPDAPLYSIVVLNYNKPLMTVQAVVDLYADPGLAERAEVIVVDNGSTSANFAVLRTELPAAVRVLRLDVNRFFGEGNNLGAELARAPFVVFLNNDAFVEPGALDALHDAFETFPDCGAAGPRFLYPDGRTQEAGAMISACGIALQRGKFLAPSSELYAHAEAVDYVSAACVMLCTETFDEIGAFDLIWDPAYYEDTDLGLKLRLLGKRVYYCPAASVVHLENTTSGDTGLALKMDGIIEINREKFISRWSEYIASGHDAPAAKISLPSRVQRPRDRPVAVLYTPYPLYPGGGERYLLTIAEALGARYDVLLATPEQYSIWRIRTLARDLQLDLSHVLPIASRDLKRYEDCAVFFAMGNEFYPQVPAQGDVAVYHCQFPFSMSGDHIAANERNLAGYGAVIVNSAFTARHYRAEAERYGAAMPDLHVIAPPAPQVPAGSEARVAKRILNVGRFAPEGHAKRQDILVQAFRDLVRNEPAAELHLAGTVPAYKAARDFVTALRLDAIDLPVTFHLNIAPERLDALYRSSAVYWHATGYERAEELQPSYQEHFGISIVEAMSAGTVPIVYRGGGPPEYIVPGQSGDLWTTKAELVSLTSALFAAGAPERERRSQAARTGAKKFAVPYFRVRIVDLLAELQQRASHPKPANGIAVTTAPDSPLGAAR